MFKVIDIERSLRDATDPAIWRRGEVYYTRGSVGTLTFEADERYPLLSATARVRGSDLYHTDISINVDEHTVVRASCDCPYAEEGAYCKHIVALGVAFMTRIRAHWGTTPIDAHAHDIADALQRGQSPRGAQKAVMQKVHQSVRERLASMGFDMSRVKHALIEELSQSLPSLPPSEGTKDATVPEIPAVTATSMSPVGEDKFGARYALIMQTDYERPQAHICDTTQMAYAWKGDTGLPRSALRAILLDTTLVMTAEERTFVTYLSTHDTWSQTFDMHHLLTCARDAKIRIYRTTFEKKNRMHLRDNASTIPIHVELKREDYKPDSPTPFTHSHSYFECSMDTREKRTWVVGVHGIASIRQREISLISLGIHTAMIMKRLREMRSSYTNTIVSTELADTEVIHINDIVSDLARAFTLTTEVTPDFVVTAYDISEPTLVVEYQAQESKLSIRGAIDYGCALFDVSEEWTDSNWSSAPHPRRRTDAKTHPLIVRVHGSQIGHARVDTKKEKQIFVALYQQYGFNKHSTLTQNSTKKIEQFLQEQWEALLKLGWKVVFTHDEINYTTSEIRTDIAADLDAARDWLAFDLDLYCGDERVRLEDVVAFIERGDECLKTADGRLIRVTNRSDLERLVRMLERFAKNEKTGKYEGKLYNAPEVADIASNSPHYRTQFAKSFKTFMTEAQSGKPVEHVKLPPLHKKLLRPYQAQGVEWMHFLRSYRFGGILADEMGLGKTIQALSESA